MTLEERITLLEEAVFGKNVSVVYDTMYSFHDSVHKGNQSLNASVADLQDTILHFNEIKKWSGLPINTDVYIDGKLIMIISSRTDYLGKNFLITYNNKKYNSSFVDGVVKF